MDRADVIDTIACIEPGSPQAELRRQRREVFRHSQRSHDVLLLPADPGGLSRAERAAIALRVAIDAGDDKLAAHYRELLRKADGGALVAAIEHPSGGDASARLAALIRHADLLAKAPRDATAGDLRRLEAIGLTSRDIVALSQLVAFVSFQTRLLAGLRILNEPDMAAGGQADAGRAPISDKHFTLEPVEWRPWLPLVDVASATLEQLAAIDAAPAGSRTSPYVLTLLHDLPSLAERSPLFNSAMYAPRGLPRAERELSTVIASMVNGCIYCASVHSRRFADLTKKPETMQRLFDEGLDAKLDPRLRAIADFAEKLTRTPGAMTGAELKPLRQAGLDDLQILDLIHSTAMFANANRLMQTLGESVPPP